MPELVLIDGRSGAGKTTLAAEIAERLGARTLHLEDLYPGWSGLAEGSRAVAEVLREGRYRRYDWAAGGFAETVELDRGAPLVIEGCGALTARNLTAAERSGGPVHGIWVECPEPVRRERADARDGGAFREHWSDWAAQEEAHLALERPVALARRIVHRG